MSQHANNSKQLSAMGTQKWDLKHSGTFVPPRCCW